MTLRDTFDFRRLVAAFRAGTLLLAVTWIASLCCEALASPMANAGVVIRGDNGFLSEADTASCERCGVVANLAADFEHAGYSGSNDGHAQSIWEYGVLKAFSSAGGLGLYASASAHARAAFDDTFTINSIGHQDERGTAHVPVSIVWSLIAQTLNQPAAYASTYGDFTFLYSSPALSGSRSWRFIETLTGNGGTTQAIVPAGVPSLFTYEPVVPIEFIFGRPVYINWTLVTAASGSGGGTGGSFNASIDAYNSVYWGGFASVVDALGNSVAYTLTSLSGTDWSLSRIPAPPVSVPEPSSLLLLIGALLSLSVSRAVRWRHR